MPPPLPPGSDAAKATQIEEPVAPCGKGQVPQPLGAFGTQRELNRAQAGGPGSEGTDGDVSPQYVTISGTNFFYAYAQQQVSNYGVNGWLQQPQPYLATTDNHSLAEIAVKNSTNGSAVEVGWTVDRVVNNGSSSPHLFVFTWTNGVPGEYNGGGWQQVSATRYPGMRVAVTTTPQQYAIQNFNGNWWVYYQSEWIGYFPAWSGFYQGNQAHWFGEVASPSTAPPSDMGNGLFSASSSAARITSMYVNIGGSWSLANPAFSHTDPQFYTVTKVSNTEMRYGGPGN